LLRIISMKAIELKELTKEELVKMLQEKKGELTRLRFAVANKQHKNYKEVSVIRKDIARIMTQLRAIN